MFNLLNYGKSDTVAHVIAHRDITAGLDTSYVYKNNNLYSGGNSNESFKNGSIRAGLLADYYNDWDSADVFRLGIYRYSWQNNGMVRLSESVNEQDRLNNSKKPNGGRYRHRIRRIRAYIGEQTADILTGRPLLEEYGHTVFRIVRPLFFCMPVAWFLRKMFYTNQRECLCEKIRAAFSCLFRSAACGLPKNARVCHGRERPASKKLERLACRVPRQCSRR